MIEKIYFATIIIVTLVVLYLYLTNERSHKRELERIETIERKLVQKQRDLELIRARTQDCPIPDLNDPRKCYFDSAYKCSWNELADRCDLSH
jgi:hypothetical protein